MHIHTVEEDYEYRMKNIMQKFVKIMILKD